MKCVVVGDLDETLAPGGTAVKNGEDKPGAACKASRGPDERPLCLKCRMLNGAYFEFDSRSYVEYELFSLDADHR